MAEKWKCTPGTVQQAYKELTREGIVVSRPGQGTRIGSGLPAGANLTPLRRATVTHHAEGFLLEMLSTGFTIEETESGFRAALDRWRALADEPPAGGREVIRFAGSHDPAVSLLASRFAGVCEGCALHLSYTGSLGGLIALAEGKADIAGCHLWDEESDTYNAPFVRRLLPGRTAALVSIGRRRLGLMARPEDGARFTELQHLTLPGTRFINRQRGAGTRVWLEAQLRRAGIPTGSIEGYEREVTTHEAVARAVAEGEATTGLGIETAAREYGLSFAPVTTETYDLVIPAGIWDAAPVQALVGWLRSEAGRSEIASLGGYDLSDSGNVTWVE